MECKIHLPRTCQGAQLKRPYLAHVGMLYDTYNVNNSRTGELQQDSHTSALVLSPAISLLC